MPSCLTPVFNLDPWYWSGRSKLVGYSIEVSQNFLDSWGGNFDSFVEWRGERGSSQELSRLNTA